MRRVPLWYLRLARPTCAPGRRYNQNFYRRAVTDGVDCICVVDYWPSINPYQTVRASSGSGDETALCDFLICNLDFLQSKFTKEPYDVWIKKADGVTDSELYDYIWSHSELQAESVDYLDQQIIEAKNDPLLQGFNGMLTLGFIITMFVCVIDSHLLDFVNPHTHPAIRRVPGNGHVGEKCHRYDSLRTGTYFIGFYLGRRRFGRNYERSLRADA